MSSTRDYSAIIDRAEVGPRCRVQVRLLDATRQRDYLPGAAAVKASPPSDGVAGVS